MRTGRPRAAVRQLERRLAILRAAAREFRKRGFVKTGMRDIAQAADLSLGNAYYYFRNKQELLYFCQDHSLERMLEMIERAEKTPGLGPAAKLHTIIEEQVRLMLDELEGAAAHLEIDELTPDQRTKTVRKRDRYERALRKIVQDGIACGELADCDAALVTRAILGAINWTVRWYRPDGPQPASQVASAFADYLVRGLRK